VFIFRVPNCPLSKFRYQQGLLISQNTIRKNPTSSSLASRYDKEWESKDDRMPEKRQTTISPFPFTPHNGFSGG